MFGDAKNARSYYTEQIAPTIDEVWATNLASWVHRVFDLDMTVRTVSGAAWFLTATAQLEGSMAF